MKHLLSAVLLSGFASLYAQRDSIGINKDWEFRIESLNVQKKVSLPHTWNVEEQTQNHYGEATYYKTLNIPAKWKGKELSLHFGAINHTSTFYINGKKVYENIGDGFNKIIFDITPFVEYGKDNRLEVRVNNAYNENKVPYTNSFDWANDGGLIRTVSLIVSDKNAIKHLHGTPILNKDNQSAKLGLNFILHQPISKGLKAQIIITEENQPNKATIYKATLPVSIKDGQGYVSIDLKKVNPWHFDFPNLYKVEASLLEGTKVTDKITTNVGFRRIELQGEKFVLNGESIKMMGIEWTAGSNPDYGFAEPKEYIIKMGKRMKEVGAMFSRIHFPQDDTFYDFCDRNGILLQEEIPLWGPETPPNDTINTIAKRQLTNMVNNHYNHPSIFAWGVGNELQGRNPKMKQMIEGWINLARQLDRTRSVSYVSNTIAHSFPSDANYTPDAGNLGDYLNMNEYATSWWSIPEAELGTYLDKVKATYPNKPFFISEFGLCEPNFRGGDKRRVKDLIYHMAVYESKPYITGAIYFDLTDYRTHYPGTRENNKFRRRIHGVYDMYGEPKPSAKVLRELSSPIEVQTLSPAKKGELSVLVFGSKGLPEHRTSGYKLYLSKTNEDYLLTSPYDVPDLEPGQKANIMVKDLYNGEGIITIVKPTGYIATQKSFYITND